MWPLPFFSIFLYVSPSWFVNIQVTPQPPVHLLQGLGYIIADFGTITQLLPFLNPLLEHSVVAPSYHLSSFSLFALSRCNVFFLCYWDLFIKLDILVGIMYCLFLFSNVKMHHFFVLQWNQFCSRYATVTVVLCLVLWLLSSSKGECVSFFEIKTSGILKMPLVYE